MITGRDALKPADAHALCLPAVIKTQRTAGETYAEVSAASTVVSGEAAELDLNRAIYCNWRFIFVAAAKLLLEQMHLLCWFVIYSTSNEQWC